MDPSLGMDYFLNGHAHGNVASTLIKGGGDVGYFRPFIGDDGRSYITINRTPENPEGRTVLTNAPATLRVRDWILMDEVMVKVATQRLKAVKDLNARGLNFNVANGMAYPLLEHQLVGDISPASISMDGLRRGQTDRPEFDVGFLPLPLIHKDFFFSARQVLVSQNNGHQGIDTTSLELASEKVGEMVEQLALGVASSYSYGGGVVYGMTNYPSRMTQVLDNPTLGPWTPSDTLDDVLDMRQTAQNAKHFGPYILYCSSNWDKYLDNDYSAAKGDNTLRQRLKAISGIQDVVTLDYLANYDMVLLHLSSTVMRMVNGLGLTTVQWETQGGMEINYKVMCIMVPQLRADMNGNTGIVHGAVA